MADYIEFNLRKKVPYYEGTKTLDGRQYRVVVHYRDHTGKWYIELTSVSDPDVSIKPLALLPGKNLWAQHGYDNILGELWVEDTTGEGENPTYEGMGDRWRLRYYPLGG